MAAYRSTCSAPAASRRRPRTISSARRPRAPSSSSRSPPPTCAASRSACGRGRCRSRSAEWRKEQYNARQPDAISLTNGFFLGNYKPSAGSYNVREGYFEAVVPLLADLPFAKRVEFDGAVRYTDYSTSGSIATWKAGLSWEIDDQLRLRGTISRDIRAPNLNELFLASASLNFAIVDPVTGTSYSVRRVTAGNRNLGPERALTKSAGIVYRPNWFPGFSASVDVYDIKIDDAIFTPDGQVVLDQCQAGVQQLCGAITRGAGNLVTEIGCCRRTSCRNGRAASTSTPPIAVRSATASSRSALWPAMCSSARSTPSAPSCAMTA
ncbi:TonB-dependent receptor [Rhizorhabdus histidinilytica]